MHMHHGLVAVEGESAIGLPVWEVALRSSLVAFYANLLRLEEPPPRKMSAPSNEMWRESFVRSAGSITWHRFADPTEYGRYEPLRSDFFTRMCLSCVISGDSAIVVPEPVPDAAALSLLREVDTSEDFFQTVIKGRRVKPVLQGVRLEMEWAYLLGVFYEAPYTLLLAMEPEVVEAVSTIGSTQPGYEVLERW